MGFAEAGSLRNILSNNFKTILWEDRIRILGHLALGLRNMRELGYFHKNLHSGNILVHYDKYGRYLNVKISDFGLSGPANEQKCDSKIYGVLPYIAPEVLNGEPYTLSSDIYSFGVIMAELSSGKPPFYDKKHNLNLALAICNGLRPEFGKGTPEIYKKLAYRCMNADPNQRHHRRGLADVGAELAIFSGAHSCESGKAIAAYSGRRARPFHFAPGIRNRTGRK